MDNLRLQGDPRGGCGVCFRSSELMKWERLKCEIMEAGGWKGPPMQIFEREASGRASNQSSGPEDLFGGPSLIGPRIVHENTPSGDQRDDLVANLKFVVMYLGLFSVIIASGVCCF